MDDMDECPLGTIPERPPTPEEQAERNRRWDAKLKAAAFRVLGCEIDAVPRTLLGCEIEAMDDEMAADWHVLMGHLGMLFYRDEDRREEQRKRPWLQP